MSELASVEKLREFCMEGCKCNDPYTVIVCGVPRKVREIADEIEREVSERFMELPEDADGVPIRIGDLLECSEYGNQTERFTVYGYTTEYSTWTGDIATLMATNENSTEFYCDRCRHVKPRTLEDVLCDMIHEYGSTDALTETIAAKYAAELRGMMEADDD